MNSKHRTEKLKTKNQKDIETQKIKTKGAKNRKNRYKIQFRSSFKKVKVFLPKFCSLKQCHHFRSV